MEIVVNSTLLDKAFQAVSVAATTSATDLTAHAVFDVTSEGVFVLAYTKRISVKLPLETVSVSDVGRFTVDIKRFRTLLSTLSDEDVTLKYDNYVVTVNTSLGEQDFASLDPSRFPWWDHQLAEAKPTAKLLASTFSRAVANAKEFAGGKEQTNAGRDFSILEMQSGKIAATDGQVAALLTVDGLESASFRIHVGTAPSILKYMSTFEVEEEVEVLESNMSLFLRRPDGAVFTEVKTVSGLPVIRVGKDEPAISWSIQKDSLAKAMKFLSSGAPDNDNHLRFYWENGTLAVGMNGSAGKVRKVNLITTDVVDSNSVELKPFALSYTAVQRMANVSDGDKMKMALVLSKGSGYVQVASDRESVKSLFFSAWLRG